MHSINYSALSGLNLLNVEDRVTQLRLNHVLNIYNGKAQSYLCEQIILRSEVSTRHTRSSSKENARLLAIPARSSSTFETKTEPLMFKILLYMT